MTHVSPGEVVHHEEVWGTVVVLQVRTTATDRAMLAIVDAVAELHRIDEWYSTFRPESFVTLLRSGALRIDHAPAEVQEIWVECERLRDQTLRRFDPWSVTGGFDPSAYVKGWGAQRASDVLTRHGLSDHLVNAGGDVVARGASDRDADGWAVGIVHPYDRSEVCAKVVLRDESVATSGLYERGNHVVSASGTVTAASASIVAPHCGEADALSTAFLVDHADLPLPQGRSVLLVVGDEMLTAGPQFE